ncbi:hypothetical protein M758_6G014700 [Ceratodon purpureus]|nr:hypothetical protein M758_6G014700 [Ceratodon purpureus]
MSIVLCRGSCAGGVVTTGIFVAGGWSRRVLRLVNDVPASSNKYLFLLDMADRLIEENRMESGKYTSINRAALRRGFSRTINLLGQSLESRGQNQSFLGRLVNQILPSGGALVPSMAIPEPFGKIWSFVGNVLSPLTGWSLSKRPIHTEAARLANLADSDIAEKFAKELLWMTQKLIACGGMEDVVQQWSSASPLAELSLCASPKVQKSLVRLSALLCKGVVENTGTPHEVCVNLILAWLPLLCIATHGGDGPIFNSLEKGDLERELERLVVSLPETDQEQVLSTWLEHYAMSQSEWPNLQNCYNAWCYTTRKLELDMSKVMKLGC